MFNITTNNYSYPICNPCDNFYFISNIIEIYSDGFSFSSTNFHRLSPDEIDEYS